MTWPIVEVADLRPAGPQDACFYCMAKMGQPHGPDCVMVSKIVKMEYRFIVEVSVPHGWSQEQIESHRNQGSWCADNALDELNERANRGGCLCSVFDAKYLDVADETPRISR